jgi:5-methylcytosine-specific restriction endonuclease McrA
VVPHHSKERRRVAADYGCGVIAKPTPKPKVRKPLRSRIKGVAPSLRERVMERDNRTCQWCLVQGGALDPHHIQPSGRGGKDELGNLVSLHRQCHRHIHENPLEAKARGMLA